MDEQIIAGGPKRSSQWKKIGGAIVIVLVVGLLGFFNWKQTTTAPPGSADQGEKKNDNTAVDTANYPDLALLASLKKLALAQDFESWTPDSKIMASRVKNLKIAQKGEINEAYVYVRATVQDKKMTKFDSLYLKFNGQGGHLFRPRSLALPESAETQVLFPLEKISYLPGIPYDESRTPSELNALAIFGPDKTVNVYSFLSSWRSGKILELSLFYGCREGQNCALEIR